MVHAEMVYAVTQLNCNLPETKQSRLGPVTIGRHAWLNLQKRPEMLHAVTQLKLAKVAACLQ